ncbi:maestro heat-like repeat-containing protein family member 1 [Mauremys reevesii]|uniref:maestro heat-like repeat-containing protein family member 1 n=1 Tax=Mauremys reevesii TaxID=260615 RepID=UPI00193F6F7D|nr:maestro heat-like repeat-containing protein family member 1 [Mauremys reevesii]
MLCHVSGSRHRSRGGTPWSPPVSKAALVESIVELIENLPGPSEPSSIMPSSMAAVCSLSKLKPPLALELESRLLRALLNRMCTLGTGQDTTHFWALYINYSQSLDILLRGLLTETPTVEKLQHLLEHVHPSLLSNNTQERARAVQTSVALLQFATSLPGFDTSSAFSKAGEFVLQLGLCISHPASDISRQARGGIYWLYWLLLQKRGLWRALHGGAEKIFPRGGAAGHPRPPSLRQPGWPGADLFHLGGSRPAARGRASLQALHPPTPALPPPPPPDLPQPL